MDNKAFVVDENLAASDVRAVHGAGCVAVYRSGRGFNDPVCPCRGYCAVITACGL